MCLSSGELVFPQSSIDVSDIVESSKKISKIGEVFDRTPAEAKALKQYSPVIGIYKTKLTLLKSLVQETFSRIYRVSPSRIEVDFPPELSSDDLWTSASLLSLHKPLLGDLVNGLICHVVDEVLRPEAVFFEAIVTDSTWSLGRASPNRDFSSIKSTVSIISSLMGFIQRNLGEVRIEFGRRFWLGITAKLSVRFGPKQELAALENSLIDSGAVPSDIPRRLSSAWEAFEADMSNSTINAVLGEIRDRLKADVNRKTMHLSIPKTDLLKNAIVPQIVSCEVVRIAKLYLDKESSSADHSSLVPYIVSLFTVLRQPDLVDPKSIDPTSFCIFFNDCVYLTLALAVTSKGSFASEILLLRSFATKAVSYFINNVSTRASAHLSRVAGGLVDMNQSATAQQAVADCIAQISACVKEWKALRIDASVLDVWTCMLVDPILKEMIRVSVENAKTALNVRSNLVNSGVWSLFRTFISATENTATASSAPSIKLLVSWKVSERVKLALCGSPSDILPLQPFPADELLYGISPSGFEALLMCNPLLQGEARNSIKNLSDRLMSSGMEDIVSAKKESGSSQTRDFASLFSRH